VSDMTRMVSGLLEIDDCSLVLVDGSMDRLAAAGPGVADGVVLAAGAVMGPDMDGVVEKTVHAVGLLTTERTTVSPPEEVTDDRIIAAGAGDAEWEIRPGTLVSDLEWATRRLERGAERLFTTGAVTDEALENLMKRGLFPELIVRDATRLFISRREKKRWEDGGGRVSVLTPLRLIAVTVNPENPEGRGFDGREFLREMRKAVPGVAVFDVMEHRNDT